jgi:RNA polymerase-binding transcription factor DksA
MNREKHWQPRQNVLYPPGKDQFVLARYTDCTLVPENSVERLLRTLIYLKPTIWEEATMTESEMKPYRLTMLALKKRIGGELSLLEEEALRSAGGEAGGGLSDVPVHPADLGTDNYEEELALELLENEDRLVREINDALQRIEEKTFDRCEECGREIPKERLDALPYARYCAQCAGKLQAKAAGK